MTIYEEIASIMGLFVLSAVVVCAWMIAYAFVVTTWKEM
jgi:hypothetical protein